MKYVLPFTLLALSTASAQTAPSYMTTTTDSAAILNMLKGQVDLYGVNFGSSEFQRGILRLLEQRVITVRVMTTNQAAPNFKPLKALGAKIYMLNANYTNSAISIKNGPAIFIQNKKFQVIADPKNASSITALWQQYWNIAKPY